MRVKFIILTDVTTFKSRNKQAACLYRMSNSMTVNTPSKLYVGIHNRWPLNIAAVTTGAGRKPGFQEAQKVCTDGYSSCSHYDYSSD